MLSNNRKIFGIGLNKTGTRSLATALRSLGFRTLHKGDAATSELVSRAAREDLPRLAYIGEQYDAYLDVEAIVTGFRELDMQYAGSRFILTTADEGAWLQSREAHVRANQERLVQGSYQGTWLEIDVDSWRAERKTHHSAVLAYFDGRPNDLLVLDIRGGDSWEELAPFLDCSVPRRNFPHENRKGLGTYRDNGRQRALLRRARYLFSRGSRKLRR